MRLLICTQKVDKNDSILGFFHRWIEEFAVHYDTVLVLCLEEGEHNLPSSVKVHSLGKENGASRFAYLVRFYQCIWRRRGDYDCVFVHMNPEYVVLGGVLWRHWGKRIGLWYTHKSVDLKLRVAERLVHIVFTASKESFRLPSKKVRVLGHGIDTDFWKPDADVKRGNHFLSVGRLMQSKRHDAAIRQAHKADVSLRIAGTGPDHDILERLASELGADVVFLGPLSKEELRDEYRTAAKLIHRSETGSLDKVVLEAAACGCPVDTTDPALAKLHLSPMFVEENHSLRKLVPKFVTAYESD